MSTLKKTTDKKSADPFDKLIFERGLRISNVIADKKQKTLLIILNNTKVLRIRLSDYKKLNSASQTQLSNWKLIGNGVGIGWSELDEDLSLKGIIRTAALNSALESLESKREFSFVA